MQQGNKVGKMTVTEFNSVNAKGTQLVRAIRPAKGTLVQDDQQLFMQVAAGGQRQLAISQAVLEKLSDPQVKILAASEVEEQTTIAAKLKEIASAMGITLPANTDSTGQTMKTQLQNLSGAQLDSFYLAEGGIRGHELLEQTMTHVSSSAKDATLKQLAAATLPVIRTHLTVSRDVQSAMGGRTGASGTGTSGTATSNQK
jgi:putative membrane protein